MEILWKGTVSAYHAETVPFHKISTPENLVKLWNFACYKLYKNDGLNKGTNFYYPNRGSTALQINQGDEKI